MKKLWGRYGFRETSGSAPHNREDVRIKEEYLCTLLIINDLLAMNGVSCEPFSGLNSLLTGKNTGNFANSDLKSGCYVLLYR